MLDAIFGGKWYGLHLEIDSWRVYCIYAIPWAVDNSASILDVMDWLVWGGYNCWASIPCEVINPIFGGLNWKTQK